MNGALRRTPIPSASEDSSIIAALELIDIPTIENIITNAIMNDTIVFC